MSKPLTALVLAILVGAFLSSGSRAGTGGPGHPCEVGPGYPDEDVEHEAGTDREGKDGGPLPLKGAAGQGNSVGGNGGGGGMGGGRGGNQEDGVPKPPEPSFLEQDVQTMSPVPDLQQAPEPGALALLLVGAGALLARWRLTAARASGPGTCPKAPA